jgi:hypothetical protein
MPEEFEITNLQLRVTSWSFPVILFRGVHVHRADMHSTRRGNRYRLATVVKRSDPDFIDECNKLRCLWYGQ